MNKDCEETHRGRPHLRIPAEPHESGEQATELRDQSNCNKAHHKEERARNTPQIGSAPPGEESRRSAFASHAGKIADRMPRRDSELAAGAFVSAVTALSPSRTL